MDGETEVVGAFSNSRLLAGVSVLVALLITSLNVFLIVQFAIGQ